MAPQGDLAEGAFEADVGLLGEGFAAGVGRGIFLAHAAGFAAVDAEAFLEDEDGFQAGSEFLFAAKTEEAVADTPVVDAGGAVTHHLAVFEEGIGRAVELHARLRERRQAEEAGEREGERFLYIVFFLMQQSKGERENPGRVSPPTRRGLVTERSELAGAAQHFVDFIEMHFFLDDHLPGEFFE